MLIKCYSREKSSMNDSSRASTVRLFVYATENQITKHIESRKSTILLNAAEMLLETKMCFFFIKIILYLYSSLFIETCNYLSCKLDFNTKRQQCCNAI